MTGARIGARGEKKSSAPDAPAVAAAAAARSATSAAAPRGESPRLPAASAIEAGLMAGHFDLRAREAGRRLRSSSPSLFRGWAVAFKWGRQLGGGSRQGRRRWAFMGDSLSCGLRCVRSQSAFPNGARELPLGPGSIKYGLISEAKEYSHCSKL